MKVRDLLPIQGYIVVDENGQPMWADVDETIKSGLILWKHKYASLFKTYGKAKGAIARSAVYSAKNKLNWPCDKYRVVSVR